MAKSVQEVVKMVLTKSDNQSEIEATIVAALTAQGKVSAEMQLAFIKAMGQSSLIDSYNMPSLGSDIIWTFSQKVRRFGKTTYPLSEKQIAVLAREFADMRAMRILTERK